MEASEPIFSNMQLKIPIWIIGMILSSTVCCAVDVYTGAIFGDGTYNYTAIKNFSVGSIQVEANEIYFDGINYCRWAYRLDYLSTDRDCGPGNANYGNHRETQETQEPPEEEIEEMNVLTVKKIPIKKTSELLILSVAGIIGITILKLKMPPKRDND